ncbi:MAG: saccharopine dehydrogenase family protein, partial [Helicobacter sp.]|nr:saccharopine dehydrogenase family protein [Helicobacter sp.]MDY5740277.1 saccharopine dehydrogenase family protein [Helicobacter sp.]
KDGKERTIYIYNICDHQTCYKEVNAQGVSYTTGVPAMIGAKLICEGKWGIGAVKIPNNADNSDMPQGGEYQGIDNAAEFADSNSYQDGNLSNNQTNFVTNTNKTLQGSGVWNMEQNDPDSFMSELNKQGLPYVVLEIESSGSFKVLENGRNTPISYLE